MATQKKVRIKALYILKLLYTGCSTKEAISPHLSSSTKNLQVKMTFTQAFWVNSGKSKRKSRDRKLCLQKMLFTRVVQGRRNITVSFVERRTFRENMTFTQIFSMNSGVSRNKGRLGTRLCLHPNLVFFWYFFISQDPRY